MTRLAFFFYDLIWTFINCISPLIARINLKFRLKFEEKNNFISTKAIENKKHYVFHCASIGEFDQALPIIEMLKKSNSEVLISVSFFSSSGYVFTKKKSFQFIDQIVYLPWDKKSLMKDFVEKLNPKVFIFIKYELWYNLIDILLKKNVDIYWIGARVSKIKFLKPPLFSDFLKKSICKFKAVSVQDKFSFESIKNIINPTNLYLVLDTRYDKVIQNKEEIDGLENRKIENLKELIDKPIFILGSVWKKDMQVLREIFNFLVKNFLVVIAPHEVSVENINWIKEELKKYDCMLWSKWDKFQINSTDMILVDTIGELRYLYSISFGAYIGGGFTKKGIHNTLESLVYGTPVWVGPYQKKQPEIFDLKKEEVCFEFSNPLTLSNKLTCFLEDKKSYLECRNRAENFIKNNTGGSTKNLEIIL